MEFVIFGTQYSTAVILTKKLMFATFGHYFNQYLTLPKNIIQISFGDNFAQCIVLSKHIVYLRITSPQIEGGLTKKIKYLYVFVDDRRAYAKLSLPKNLVKLKLGCLYDQSVQLPKYLKYYQMPCNKFYNKLILSPNIVSLTLGDIHTKYYIDNLTFLKNIHFVFSNRSKNYCMYDNLPNGIHVVSHDGFDEKINNLPNTVINTINTRYSYTLHNEQQLFRDAQIDLSYHKMIYHTE